MGYADELLQSCALNEAQMLEELQQLRLYCGDLELESWVFAAREEAPLPHMVTVLGAGQEEDALVVTSTIQPLDREDARLTKYVQLYSELFTPVHRLDQGLLMEAVLRLNGAIPLSAVLLVPPRDELGLPVKVALRCVCGFPMGEVIDQGVYTETLSLFELGCTGTAMVLEALLEGKSIQEAMALIGQ